MNDNQPPNGPSGRPDAATWFARLQRRPDDGDLRRSFETWLAADPRNRQDWESVNGAWDRLGALKDDSRVQAARRRGRLESPVGERGHDAGEHDAGRERERRLPARRIGA